MAHKKIALLSRRRRRHSLSRVSTFSQSLDQDLKQRQKNNLYRTRQVTETPQGAEIIIEGKKYLNFSSNDYLGLANHPDIIKALQSGAEKYGVGSGAAHLISGHSSAHHALEEELAEFTGRQRALIFSTGYMANLGVFSALLKKGDTIFEDKLNHASMIDGGLLSGAILQRYLHADMDSLNKKISDCSTTKLIATDGVFSMDGDIAPLNELAAIAKQQQAWLMVDDAHGLGVIGKQGKGTLELKNLIANDVHVLMGTFGKAFGTFGAFIAGDEVLIEILIQKARTYIYTTAIPPAIAHATRTSLKLIIRSDDRREYLQTLIKQFRAGAEQLGLNLMSSNTAIQPLLIKDAEKVISIKNKLQQQGFIVGAIRSPTVPVGTERLRITLSATHKTQHVEQLLFALECVSEKAA